MRLDFLVRNRLAIFAALGLVFAAFFTCPVKVLAQSTSAGAQAPTDVTKPKTAGEAFKNIQILKDIRQDELFPSMRYITAALGVRCEFCHVPDHFEEDDKPAKARAREMMKMMFAINTDNFRGRRQITCYTCHRGSEHPVGTPAIPDAATMAAQVSAQMAAPHGSANPPSDRAPSSESGSENPAAAQPPAASLPTVDEILAKYAQALGGTDAIQKSATRVEKGTVDIPEHNAHNTMEVYRKAPDKGLAILHSPIGDVVEGYDGNVAWENRAGHGVTEETGDSLNRVKEWATFVTALDLKQAYSRSVVSGIEKIAGRDAYRVIAFRKGGGMERIYFDTQSGLLVRIDTRIDSPLGSLPQETSYEDYRAVGGVNVPYTIRVARVDSTTIYKWNSVESNVPVGDERFEKPPSAAPPATDKPGGDKPQ